MTTDVPSQRLHHVTFAVAPERLDTATQLFTELGFALDAGELPDAGLHLRLDWARGIAKKVVGIPLDGSELLTRAVQLLADEHPDLVDPTPGRWVGSMAGGILGKVRFLVLSPREYIVIFGSPTGAQGFSGRYKHVEIHKFLKAGRIDSYDIESDDTDVMTLLPGEHTCLKKGHARGLSIHPAHGTSSTAAARWSPRCRSRWSTPFWCHWSSSPSDVRRPNSSS